MWPPAGMQHTIRNAPESAIGALYLTPIIERQVVLMTGKTRHFAMILTMAAALALANVRPCLGFDWTAFNYIEGFKLTYSAFSALIGEERWQLGISATDSEHETRLEEEKQKEATRRQKVREEKGPLYYYIVVVIMFVISCVSLYVGACFGFFASLVSLFEWFMYRLLF